MIDTHEGAVVAMSELPAKPEGPPNILNRRREQDDVSKGTFIPLETVIPPPAPTRVTKP